MLAKWTRKKMKRQIAKYALFVCGHKRPLGLC